MIAAGVGFFREEDHTYWLDGRRVPGFTEVVRGLGLNPNANYYTEEGRKRGSAVHAALHYYLDGGVDWASIDERVRGYVEAGVEFLKTINFEPRLIEAPRVHPVYLFGCKPDLIGEMLGTPVIVDYKTGDVGSDPDARLVGLQTAAAQLVNDLDAPWTAGRHTKRFAVQLWENGRYKAVLLRSPHDHARWLNAVDLYRAFLFREEKLDAAA